MKKEAERALIEMTAGVLHGRAKAQGGQSVSEYLQYWLKTKKTPLTPSAYDTYARSVCCIVPHIGP